MGHNWDMTEALTKHDDSLRYGFSDEQVEVIKATIAPGVSDAELALFLMVCQKSGLDPFSRQIYLSERTSSDGRGGWVTKKSPETTIDGFRVIAERSGKYAGQQGPYWCGQDGQWKDVWLGAEPPSAAKVGILRTDFGEPIWAVALYSEYVQRKKARPDGTPGGPNSMWQKMAANQLAKCAESLGLRKAFPRDLSGFYSREEMGQADVTATEAREEVKQRKLQAIRDAKQIEAPKEFISQADADAAEPPGGWQGATGTKDIENRHAAEVQETEAVLADTEANPKPKRKKGDISFKALAAFKELKRELREITGTDQIYYDTLKAAGVSHADELAHEPSKAVWKAMAAIVAKLRADKTTREEFQAEASRLASKMGFEGPKLYKETLASNGFESLDQLIEEASSEQVTAILAELRAH